MYQSVLIILHTESKPKPSASATLNESSASKLVFFLHSLFTESTLATMMPVMMNMGFHKAGKPADSIAALTRGSSKILFITSYERVFEK